MPKISVIMPVYNSEESLQLTISSVLNQTYKNFELIIINDGSTDKSDIICEKFSKENNKIIYKKIDNNGVSNARNIGLTIASGDYVTFIDSDDIYEKDTLEKLYNSIIKYNVDWVIASYRRVNLEKNKKVSKIIENKIYYKENFNKVLEKCQSRNLFNQLWNKIYKLDIIKKCNIKFDTNLSLGEDYKFNLQYIKEIDNILTEDYIIYNYIISDSGLNNKYRKNRLDINMMNMELLENIYEDEGYNKDYINKKYVITMLSGLKNICQNPNKEEIISELKSFIKNKKYRSKISSNITFKYRIILIILTIKNVHFLKCVGHILCCAEKIYKKIKLGY